jgi:hypothetical protein
LALAASLLVAQVALLPQALAEDDWLRSIPEFALSDQAGVTHALAEYADRDLLVL